MMKLTEVQARNILKKIASMVVKKLGYSKLRSWHEMFYSHGSGNDNYLFMFPSYLGLELSVKYDGCSAGISFRSSGGWYELDQLWSSGDWGPDILTDIISLYNELMSHIEQKVSDYGEMDPPW